MQLESAKHLEDIRQAGRTVLEATAGRTLDDYLRDKLLRLAVERCFEIIGEAMHRLDERDHETAARITDFERIIGLALACRHDPARSCHRARAALHSFLPLGFERVVARWLTP